MQKQLEIKSGSAFSKLKKKRKRVDALVDVVADAVSCLSGMFVTIYTLENASEKEWDALTEALQQQNEYVVFRMAIEMADNDDILPVVKQA